MVYVLWLPVDEKVVASFRAKSDAIPVRRVSILASSRDGIFEQRLNVLLDDETGVDVSREVLENRTRFVGVQAELVDVLWFVAELVDVVADLMRKLASVSGVHF